MFTEREKFCVVARATLLALADDAASWSILRALLCVHRGASCGTASWPPTTMGDKPDIGSSWPAPPKYYKEPPRAPPAPPADGETYQIYGVVRPGLGSLPELPGLEEQLYTATTEAEGVPELRRLNDELLNSFLKLLRMMQETPTQCNAQVTHIRSLLLSMQHLLSSFRPYQAREELIAAVQAQVAAKQQLVDECRENVARAEACAEEDDTASPDEKVGAAAGREGSSSFEAVDGDVSSSAAEWAGPPMTSEEAKAVLLASAAQQQAAPRGTKRAR